RCMHIYEIAFLEELVHSKCQGITNFEDRVESTCTETQMCNLAKEFQTMLLRLQREFFRIRVTDDRYISSFDLYFLSFTQRFYQISFYTHSRTRSNPF